MKNQSSIVLGTWSWGTGAVGGDQVFGNHVGVEELKPVFDEAMKNGLNLWDSAVVYGMGASENVLAAFTKTCCREEVKISTKFTPQIARYGKSRSRYACRKPRALRYGLHRHLLGS